VRGRLSLLMFLQYAPQGAVVPLFSLRLQELGFSPLEIGWASATQALAALIAPLVAGQVADRWWPAERCLAACALTAGGLLWILAGLTRPPDVFAVSLAFWLVMGPASTLGTALSFTHLPQPERDFGRVRLWGTIGWVVAGWLLGLALACTGLLSWAGFDGSLGDAFRVASVLAFALAGYALTLPHTPPQRRRGAWLAPLAALRVLRGRAFLTFWVCSFGLCVTLPFPTQVIPLLLAHRGLPRDWLGPVITLNQSAEIVALAVLPVFLLRLGIRGTMLLGLVAWALLLAVLTLGEPLGLVIASMTLNGLCICCFIVAGQVFVNSRTRGDLRASAQALLTCMNGLGLLTGNLLAGWVRAEAEGGYAATFGVGAALALGLVAVLYLGFRESESEPAGPAPVPVAEPQAAPGR
jgi:MFS family permease